MKERVEERRKEGVRQEEGKGRQRERRTEMISSITRTHCVSCALHILSPCILMVIRALAQFLLLLLLLFSFLMDNATES